MDTEYSSLCTRNMLIGRKSKIFQPQEKMLIASTRLFSMANIVCYRKCDINKKYRVAEMLILLIYISFHSLSLHVSASHSALMLQSMECILDGLPKYGAWTAAALARLEEVASDDMTMRVEVIEQPAGEKLAVVDLYYLEETDDGWKMQGVREALNDDSIW